MRDKKKTDMSKKRKRIPTDEELEKLPNEELEKLIKQAELDYALAISYNFHLLSHMRMAYFEPDGTVLTEDAQGTYRRPGRQHITRMINLFKSKDDPQYYRMCAVCKDLLDEYDATFVEKEKAPE